jgi:hypothetical protein
VGIALGGKNSDKVQAAQLKLLCAHFNITPIPPKNPARIQALKANIVPSGD